MRLFSVKRAVITIGVLVLLGIIFLATSIFIKNKTNVDTGVLNNKLPPVVKIGSSVQGREIDAYTYGTGGRAIVIVGGIHGGYEWNSVLLAYKIMDYLGSGSSTIPSNLKVTVIPSANPDGVFKVIGKEGRFYVTDIPVGTSSDPGRFNANGVDLNRNFDCKWQPTGSWKGKIVSAGTAAFSEPESKTLRDFLLKEKPQVAIFLHSQANAVYASQCNFGILPETTSIMNLYSKASGYPAIQSFDSYVVTGAVEDWLASVGIPAITVELKTHETIEWEQNLLALRALFDYLSKK